MWVADGPGPVTVVVGDERWREGEPVSGGLRFRLTVPPGASAVTVTRGARRLVLPLAEATDPSWLAPARELLAAGRTGELERLLLAPSRSPDPGEQGRALSIRGRLAYSRGEGGGALLRAATRAWRRAGRLRETLDDGTLAARAALEEGDFATARALLDGLPPAVPAVADGRYLVDFYRGLLAEATGDSRGALAVFARAVERARRLGLDGERRAAEQVLARELSRLGRYEEAAERFAALAQEEDGGDPCERVSLLVNQGWALLSAREAHGGGVTAADPAPLFAEVLELLDGAAGGCPRVAEERRNAAFNAALAHLQAGRPGPARRALAMARAIPGEPRVPLLLWWIDLEGRLALAAGRREAALDRYRELAALADASAQPEAAWRAAVGLARVHGGRGETAAAIAALTAAEEGLVRESLAVPVQEGRDTFLAQREAGTRLLVDLLLREGRPGEALAVVRRARSRALSGLVRSARLGRLSGADRERWDRTVGRYRELRAELDAAAGDDWQRAADELVRAQGRRAVLRDELRRRLDHALALLGGARLPALPPLPPGEVLLAFHPLPTGWVVLAARDGEVRTRRLDAAPPAADPAALTREVLDPIADWLDGARRLRVLPYGSLKRVDFHALPWRGGALLDALPVVYGVDVEVPPVAGSGVLVVGDPRGDLRAARGEAAAVAELLAGRGSLTVLMGDGAGGSAVRAGLAGAGLFHYAGHGRFGDGGGIVLPLAAGAELTVGDVLILPGGPRWVVLAGCETGRSPVDAPGEALGLAQAFVLAGARGVVAAARPVSDQETTALIRNFYRHWGAAGDPAPALRRAVLAARDRSPGSDWSAFRLLEP
jgi:tetratricopeptide (TPR) repeat protein